MLEARAGRRASSACRCSPPSSTPKASATPRPEVGLGEQPPIEKTVFSAARAEGFDLQGRRQAIVCGIETHVCVSQTVLDLLAGGLEVHVPADAVGSRHAPTTSAACAAWTTPAPSSGRVESVLFELLERAGTPEFKAVQKLII